jgi:hypothetical protein
MKQRILALYAFVRFFGWRWLVALPLLALAVFSARTAYLDHKTVDDLRAQLASQKGQLVQFHDQNGHKLGSVIIPQQAGDFWVNQTAVSPLAIKDTGGVTRDTFETAHGRAQFGGGGSDYKVVCGPLPSFETSNGGCSFVSGATTPSSVNVGIYGDNTSTFINTPSATGKIGFIGAGSATNAQFDWNASRFYVGGFTGSTPLIIDWATPNQTQLYGGSATSSFVVGTTASGGVLGLLGGAGQAVMQIAGGTQNGVAIGSFQATVGHIRTPAGFQWLARNSANTGNNSVLYDDGADSIYLASGGYLNVYLNGSTSSGIMAGGTVHAAAVASGFNIGSSITSADMNTWYGGAQLTTISINANRTLDTTTKDNIVIVDTSGGVVSVTLPTPSNGRWMTIVDKKNTFGTNACTLVRHAAEKIDNVAASKTLNASGYRGNLVSDGTDWYTMNVSGERPASIAGALLALGLILARRRAHNDTESLKEAA